MFITPKYIAIVDMGLLRWLSAPSLVNREKGDGTVSKWEDYGDKVCKIILTRYPSPSVIIAVNDYHENDVINVKDEERRKHSADFFGGQTENVFL